MPKPVTNESENLERYLSTRLPSSLYYKIVDIAHGERRTVANMARVLLDEAIAARKRKRKRKESA